MITIRGYIRMPSQLEGIPAGSQLAHIEPVASDNIESSIQMSPQLTRQMGWRQLLFWYYGSVFVIEIDDIFCSTVGSRREDDMLTVQGPAYLWTHICC